MASVSEPVTFREFCPLYYLLNAIPTKIQKGFRSLVVYLTALDTNGDYIAVGSSIGMLYLYCRRHDQMRKYNFEVGAACLPDVLWGESRNEYQWHSFTIPRGGNQGAGVPDSHM